MTVEAIETNYVDKALAAVAVVNLDDIDKELEALEHRRELLLSLRRAVIEPVTVEPPTPKRRGRPRKARLQNGQAAPTEEG